MVGYVLDGNVATAIDNVEDNIRRQHAALGMNASGELLPSTVLAGEARARETHHKRTHETELFRIHHLFMAGRHTLANDLKKPQAPSEQVF
jgi:hypothetical protein